MYGNLLAYIDKSLSVEKKRLLLLFSTSIVTTKFMLQANLYGLQYTYPVVNICHCHFSVLFDDVTYSTRLRYVIH
jgi:hypothetical protein